MASRESHVEDEEGLKEQPKGSQKNEATRGFLALPAKTIRSTMRYDTLHGFQAMVCSAALPHSGEGVKRKGCVVVGGVVS